MRQWPSISSQKDSPPVELRFIDLFMAMIGCLMLIIIVLSVVPRAGFVPKSKLDEIAEKLAKSEADNAGLKSRLGCESNTCLPSKDSGTDKWFSASVTLFWLDLNVETNGCASAQPALYVRYNGHLYDSVTSKQVDDAKQFNPLNTSLFRTMLPGDKYLPSNDVNADNRLSFHGIRPSDISYIYVGLQQPKRVVKCVLKPSVITAAGEYLGSEISLTSQKPFALLAVADSNYSDGVHLWTENYRADDVTQVTNDLNASASQALRNAGLPLASAAFSPRWEVKQNKLPWQ